MQHGEAADGESQDHRRAAGTRTAQSYARRIVHLVVGEDASMMTESIGDAFLKTVVISKAKS